MLKNVKTFISGGILGAFMVSLTASADPNFEVEPVNLSTLPGTLIHNPMAIKWDPVGGNKRVSIVESEGVPGGQAIAFQVKRKNISKPWELRMRAPFDKDILAEDSLEIYFWARAAKLPKGRDAGKISVVLGRNEEPYDTVINQDIAPTTTWKMYRVSGTAKRDFPASEADMGFNFGHAKQTIELGPYFATRNASPTE